MIDGRDAPYRSSRLITVLSDKPEAEAAVFYDHVAAGLGRLGRLTNDQLSSAAQQRKLGRTACRSHSDAALAAAGLARADTALAGDPSP